MSATSCSGDTLKYDEGILGLDELSYFVRDLLSSNLLQSKVMSIFLTKRWGTSFLTVGGYPNKESLDLIVEEGLITENTWIYQKRLWTFELSSIHYGNLKLVQNSRERRISTEGEVGEEDDANVYDVRIQHFGLAFLDSGNSFLRLAP